MIRNVNGIFVEILGELIPACNIQIWDWSPEVRRHEHHDTFYGIYFEVMFEDGCNLTVDQEMARILNKEWSSNCKSTDDEHFIVELTSQLDGVRSLNHTWHCEGEENLLKVLSDEINLHKMSNRGMISIAGFAAAFDISELESEMIR